MRTKKLLSLFAILFIALLMGCEKDDYNEIEFVCPVVSSTIPANGSFGVPLNQVISINFNEEMNPATIDLSSIIISAGNVVIPGSVSYSGLTATFRPTSRLTTNTLYTGKVTTDVKDQAGNALQTDYIWTFTTGLNPLVVSTDPANLAVDVDPTKVITATFNMSMNPASLNASTFTIKQGTIVVPGIITYAGTMATFAPTTALDENKVYTATITKGAENTIGTELATDYVWTFTTGLRPIVVATDPVNNATGIPLNKAISATFNMPMNALTLIGTTFTVTQGTNPVLGVISYSGSTVTFTPSSPLIGNALYTATITTDAKNLAGTPLASNYVWTFTTSALPFVVSTDPINNATGVVLNKVIRATFNMPMNASTLNTSTFTVKQGATTVLGVISYSGTTVSFTPATPLTEDKIYTATITSGAQNTSGVPIANNYVWNFTTGVVPVVISTDPANNATGIALNKAISATFNMPMNALTLIGTTFTVNQGTNPVLGIISYSGSTVTFTPSSLLVGNTLYTATITTDAKNLAGTPIENNYVWSFTTSPVPFVISTDPIDNAVGVGLNKVIRATFNMPMNSITLNNVTFTVKQGAATVLGSISYSGTTVSFTPTTPLVAEREYTATITTGAQNTVGVPLANNYVWNFTTGTTPIVVSTDPTNNATNVPLNKIIRATFNVQMNSSTLNNSTFTVKQGATTVLGAISYSGTTVSFVPNNPLSDEQVYTCTITTGAQSIAGIPIANNYIWNFTTLKTIIVVPPTAGLFFGVFGGNAGITNQGLFTVVNGTIGTIAASSLITGFTDGLTADVYTVTPLNNGNVTKGIFAAAPAPGNATKAATALAGLNAAKDLHDSISPALLPGGVSNPGAGELGGLTLSPGIYTALSSFKITDGNLVLDARGDSNAKWYFQAPSSLTVGDAQPSSVTFLGGVGNPANVYWYVGSSAVINYAGGGTMVGNIIARAGVTLSSPANSTNPNLTTLNGRAISLEASVTMVNTVINVPN